MDAAYLQKNIADALNEALTSMTIKHPEDEVEFLGRFLLKYGERKNVLEESKKSLAEAETKLAAYQGDQQVKYQAAQEKQQEQDKADSTYTNFLAGLATAQGSKAEVMQEVANFIETGLNVPAAYVAAKRVAGEVETLNYVAASPSQGHVVGQKLVKVAVNPDAEDAPTRQGISFDCLKVPEAPEEEAAEDEDADPDAPKIEKAPLVATPLVVENVMRETRCKFFGIPKLGAFVAIPFSYQSLDNENGCVLNPGEGEAPEPKYELARSKAEFVIGIDSIGKYRLFAPAEIERIQAMGNELIKVFEALEAKQGEAQLAFFNDPKLKQLSDAVPDCIAKLAEAEAQAMERAAAETAVDPDAAPADEGAEPAPGADLLKPATEAQHVAVAIGKAVSSGPVGEQIDMLSGYVLPLPAAANNLLFACGCLLGEDPKTFSECGSANWDAFRTNLLPTFTGKVAEYNCASALTGLASENTVASIKAYCEANAIADPSTLPPSIPALAAICTWLQKALAAREAWVAYQQAANQIQLEILA